MRQVPEVLDRIAAAASEIMPQHFSTYRCLNATRVILDVASRLRLPARPLVVQALVFNAAFLKQTKELNRMPNSVAEREQWHADHGAHSLGVGLGGDPEPDKWHGHLVAIVRGWLVDAASSQMNRPQHGMPMPEVLVYDAPEKFQRGAESLAVPGDGSMIYYKAIPHDLSFEKLPGFQRNADNTMVVNEILEHLNTRSRA
jgi:hypothetical protein